MEEIIFEGNIVDVVAKRIFKGQIKVNGGRIAEIKEMDVDSDQYILPGLIDAHVHIESSMLVPSEFARLASVQGTTATVSDPHEIANVLGIAGIDFMVENAKKVPFGFNFGAPSCVPATPFETAGAELGAEEIDRLLQREDILYLSEMMNFPGVLFKDEQVMAKLAIAKKYNKPVDGHAPGVLGNDARKYAAAGISTDHECFTIEEARDKIAAGMKVQIREGSAAKNFEALVPLLNEHPDMIMFCSDDKHPDDLERGHINQLIKRALDAGYNFLDILRACTYIPTTHYKLDCGLLQMGDAADFCLIDHPQSFNVLETWYHGELIAKNGKSLIQSVDSKLPNNFNARKITLDDIRIHDEGHPIKVFQALDGQLITTTNSAQAKVVAGNLVSDPDQDVLKIIVMNRYAPTKPAVAFVQHFGLKKGAIASSVAHDSHNIIAVGCSDEDIVHVVNRIVDAKGGVACTDGQTDMLLPLPVAGIMSADDAHKVARAYEEIDKMAKSLGSKLNAPYMTLSFMALLVIPELKLSDKGLFDGKKFKFTSVFQ